METYSALTGATPFMRGRTSSVVVEGSSSRALFEGGSSTPEPESLLSRKGMSTSEAPILGSEEIGAVYPVPDIFEQ